MQRSNKSVPDSPSVSGFVRTAGRHWVSYMTSSVAALLVFSLWPHFSKNGEAAPGWVIVAIAGLGFVVAAYSAWRQERVQRISLFTDLCEEQSRNEPLLVGDVLQ